MPCRATWLTDPVLGGMQPAAFDSQGRLAADRSGTVEPVPVILFEPVQAVLMQNTVSGLMQDARVEAVIAAGFGRVPVRIAGGHPTDRGVGSARHSPEHCGPWQTPSRTSPTR